MTNGVVGVVCCPMVDDNLVYSLTKDPEEKHISIVRNGNEATIIRKLEKANIGFKMIDWNEVVDASFEPEDGFNILIVMIALGLHAEPKKLKSTVEEIAGEMQDAVDCIGFYLGTCGNYDWNIPEWCRSMGYKPAFTFCDKEGNLCHDCVGINIAGGPRYLDLEKKYTGHLFVFPAMASNYDDFMNADRAQSLKEEEALTDEIREALGIEPGRDGYMRWLFKLGDYQYLLKINTGIGDQEHFQENSEIISKRTGLMIKEAEPGWADLQPTDDLYANCKRALPQ